MGKMKFNDRNFNNRV